jgi:hypothetical protein
MQHERAKPLCEKPHLPGELIGNACSPTDKGGTYTAAVADHSDRANLTLQGNLN